jgi:hypothetical protein
MFQLKRIRRNCKCSEDGPRRNHRQMLEHEDVPNPAHPLSAVVIDLFTQELQR